MQEILSAISAWNTQGKRIALAIVLETWRSAPRKVGSCMAISEELEFVGSVSGGCVEVHLLQQVKDVWQTGESRLLHFGVSDAEAWDVGLSCGGKITVWLTPLTNAHFPWLHTLTHALHARKGAIWVSQLTENAAQHAILLSEGTTEGTLTLSETLTQQVWQCYRTRRSQLIEEGAHTYFVNVFATPTPLLIFGAAHLTNALVALAHRFDFTTTLIDPRRAFTQGIAWEQAPHKLLEEWPQEALDNIALTRETFAVLLTHDPKIDDPALHVLLRAQIPYIGALGSRKTQEKRKNRLREAGFTESEIEQIKGPVGLNIGAETPEEIALSIVAEMVQVRAQLTATLQA